MWISLTQFRNTMEDPVVNNSWGMKTAMRSGLALKRGASCSVLGAYLSYFPLGCRAVAVKQWRNQSDMICADVISTASHVSTTPVAVECHGPFFLLQFHGWKHPLESSRTPDESHVLNQKIFHLRRLSSPSLVHLMSVSICLMCRCACEVWPS